ncbi:ABC transporter permease [Microbacterium sp. ARD32]|uniref:ABC transporter permease n=1 Tax=Microbacterium sp. ARD32 TaxID=2962577 RepID=UPI00288162EE|nr:ABC transporter permease [Microbacterium sp. ARD32]MDT0158214.1 ABC transporter permease [Microbacterium sp. ARD32]
MTGTATAAENAGTRTAAIAAPRVPAAVNGYTLLGILSIVAGILIWWGLSIVNPAGSLPSPLAVLVRFGELIAVGTLLPDLGASLSRVLMGFAIGTGLAIPLGFLMGWYRPVRAVLEPWTQFFRMIPPLAIIPLAIVLMGIGEVPKVFVITLAAFLVSIVATFQGVLNVDRTLINAGRVLGASDVTIFRRIVVPASLPFIMVGMRQGLGAAWATLVAAELIAAQAGIGYRMQQAQIYYDLPTIFVGLVSIGVIGLIMDRILLWADKHLTSWQERR